MAAAVFTGCGDAEHPATSARVVSTAAARTSQADTARFSEKITGTLNGQSLGEGSMSGVVDSRRRNASFAYDLSPIAKAGRADPNAFKGRLVYLGENAFLSIPAINSRLPAGRRWIEVTRRQLEAWAPGTGNLSGAGMLDATKPVDHLRAAIGDTDQLGTEIVNGAATRHYRTHLDYRLYVPLVRRADRPAFRRVVAKVGRTFGGTRYPIEVWIGSDGTVRRTMGVVEGRGLHLEYTLDLTAIGRPVRIKQPPQTYVLDARKP